MSLVRGMELLARLQTGRYRSVDSRTENFSVGKTNFRCHVFSPSGVGESISHPKLRGNMMLVHGMTLKGIDDPRMVNLGRCFASLGFRVYSPHFEEIAGLVITPDSWPRVQALIAHLNQKLATRIALFSASFSAGITLIAAFKQSHSVSAVCTVGTLGSVDSTLDFLMGQQGIDDFGTLICMWNCLKLPPPVKKGLFVAAEDNSYLRDPPHLPEILKKMSKSNRDLLVRLRADREFRLKKWRVFTATKAFRKLYEGVSPIEHAINVPFSVHLIHGEDDDVIPATESVLLDARLNELGVKSHLCLTPLISHGHSSAALTIPRVYRLGAAFGHFMASASAG